MGCLLILNDDERNTFWRNSIFKLENITKIESLIILILTIISEFTFPYNELKITKKKIKIRNLLVIIPILSLFALIISFIIKYIHYKKNIKPNYRLCIMHSLSIFNFFLIILCFILSLYISDIIHNWANIYEFVQYTKTGKIIYIFILNNLISFFSLLCFVDLLVQAILFSKIAKFFSLGNNINNKKLLFEFFRINYHENNEEKFKENNSIIFFNKEKNDENKTLKKLRITFPKQNDGNGINTFENNINKFKEVELIEKIEYKSIGIQTEEDMDINNINNIKNESSLLDRKIIEEDFSKNIILLKNKSLINSFSTND